MKKKLIGLMTLMFSTVNYSQITLENTITSDAAVEFIQLKDNSTKYYEFSDFVMKIYNIDHSIYKTITINKDDLGFISAPNLYEPLIFNISQNIFDNDDDIEFLFYATNQTFSQWKTFIIDNDGTILFEKNDQIPQFNRGYSATDTDKGYFITETSDGWKMILEDATNTPKSQYIYSLNGNTSLSLSNISKTASNFKIYPNPSRNFTNVEYHLPENIKQAKLLIYDLNGLKVKEYNIDNHINYLRISNRDITSGTYLYTILAHNYKSKSLKLIIE